MDEELSQNNKSEGVDGQAEQEFSDELIARDEELMRGLSPINWGALIMPPIWGPAHGVWITILFYPAWVFADNTFYAAFTEPSALSCIFAALIFISLVAVTLIFARLSQPMAVHRAAERGKTKEQFKREETIWVIVSGVLGILMLAWATYFNLCLR